MKIKLVIFILSSVTSSLGFSSSTNICTNYPGVYICENGQVKNINGTYGSVLLENMEVSGVVNGSIGAINIKQSKINQIKGSIGSFMAANSTFLGKIEGNIGSVQFKKSILKEIDVHTSNVQINNSTVEKITISSLEKKITINISNKSIVNGDVCFLENFGTVCIDYSSELIGNVINGKIIRGSC